MRFPSMRLLAAFFSVAGVACAQTACLDQSYVPTATNGLEVTASQSVTQTFTVGLGGQLTRVEIALVNWHLETPGPPTWILFRRKQSKIQTISNNESTRQRQIQRGYTSPFWPTYR